MDQPVEPAEFIADGFRQMVVVRGGRGGEVEQGDRGLRAAHFFYFIIDAVELGAVAA